MANNPVNQVVRHLRRVAFLHGAGETDGQLLRRFIESRDEAAFEALLRRHGPMVLNVCQRIVRNRADAEDAFQSTFLVLVRKADSVKPREKVGNWLYGVAYQTAIRVKAMSARRSTREKQVAAMPETASRERRDDWTPLLDQELSRLPEKYRTPIVLCDLEGRSRKEVARQLGWAEGSLSSRLARGRAMLAKRLTRHGLALSAETLAFSLSRNTASACLPPSLVSATVKAASVIAAGPAAATTLISAQVAAITEGILKTMLLTKLKTMAIVSCIVCLLGVGVGASLLSGQTPAAESQPTERKTGGAAKNSSATRANESERKIEDLQCRLEMAQAKLQVELAMIRAEIESLRKNAKTSSIPQEDGKMQTQMFTSRHIHVSELHSVLDSLFNTPGQPKKLRVAAAPSLKTLIVQGRPEDLDRARAMVDELEHRAAALREELRAAPQAK
jgi:RNA polymerase sigma factor (sigma-70 family)